MDKGLRVLIVDDDPAFLSFARDGLRSVARVDIAQTPLEALWALERNHFDAVVCDLVLGRNDGRHLLETVRARWPDAARVLVTGFGDRVGADILAPTVQAILHKPCGVAELKDVLTAERHEHVS